MGENVHEYDGVLFDDDYDEEYEETPDGAGCTGNHYPGGGGGGGNESSSEDEFLELPFNERTLYRH